MARRVCVRGGTVLTSGRAVPGADVLLDGDRIAAVGHVDAQLADATVVDAVGCLVIPGLVNAHAHGCTTGPLFSSGAPGLSREQVMANADRHLAAGVTTLVNVCGFGLPEDVIDHALDIRLGTTHLPAAVRAARIVDAAGLDGRHREMTAAQMIADGAVALGEIGSGATLGGGVAAYRYVPEALESTLGRRLEPDEATALIDALVGTTRLAAPNDDALAAAMADVGVPADLLSAVRAAIMDFAVAPVHESLESFAEAAALSEQWGVPAVFHAAGPSGQTLLDLARTTDARIVAGHLNHTSFTPDEAVALGRQLRDAGAVIDVSSLDIVHARHLATPDVADALAREGLVDTLSTDYAGGAWEPMLGVVQHWRSAGYITLEEGIAMCTSTPAEVFGLTDRGRIEPGLRADLVVVSPEDVSDVRCVIAAGDVIVGG